MPEATEGFCIAAGAACLDGHFPGRPLVPAVVLLDEACALARAHTGALRLARVLHAKFLRPVGPGQRVTCHFEGTPARLRFRLELDGAVAAQGELELTERT